VIRAEVEAGGVVLRADLLPGSLAYVDRDWLPTTSGPVPSIVVTQNGRMAWCDGPTAQKPEHVDRDTAAALVLLSVAREAATVAEGLDPVAVTGIGLVARLVRALMDDSMRSERPGAVVETTGQPAVIADAVGRVADLGTVVLVGESPRAIDLDLYADVHVRGLTLVGVAPPLQRSTGDTQPGDGGLVTSSLESLGRVAAGTVVPDATWFRITA
jgi:hypothetical protein